MFAPETYRALPLPTSRRSRHRQKNGAAIAAPMTSSRTMPQILAHLGLHLRGLAAEHLEDQAGVVGQPAGAESDPIREVHVGADAPGCGRPRPSACTGSRCRTRRTGPSRRSDAWRAGCGSITSFSANSSCRRAVRRRAPSTSPPRRNIPRDGDACGPAGRSPRRARSRSGATAIRVSLAKRARRCGIIGSGRNSRYASSASAMRLRLRRVVGVHAVDLGRRLRGDVRARALRRARCRAPAGRPATGSRSW